MRQAEDEADDVVSSLHDTVNKMMSKDSKDTVSKKSEKKDDKGNILSTSFSEEKFLRPEESKMAKQKLDGMRVFKSNYMMAHSTYYLLAEQNKRN